MALSEGSRTRAKQNLKRSKMIEEAVEKKRNLLDNIDHVRFSKVIFHNPIVASFRSASITFRKLPFTKTGNGSGFVMHLGVAT